MSSGSLSAAEVSSASSPTQEEYMKIFCAPHDNSTISMQDRKDRALIALKSELMDKLNKEVKSLDEDNWMYEGPRSRIHLISRRGGVRQRRMEVSIHGDNLRETMTCKRTH